MVWCELVRHRMGLSLLFPGSGSGQKESDAAAPLPANLIRRSGRSSALPYPPYEQSNYYFQNPLLLFIDSFSLVHWWGCGTYKIFWSVIRSACERSPNYERSVTGIFLLHRNLTKKIFGWLEPFSNKFFSLDFVRIAQISKLRRNCTI